MTKREFLDTLRTQLQGDLNDAQIEGHLHYYREYISEAVSRGKTEAEVIEEIGNPVFIAKTILDTSDTVQGTGTYEQSYQQNSYDNYNGDYQYEERGQKDFFGGNLHTWNVNPKIVKWVVPVVIGIILFLLFSLIGSIIMLVARFFIPLLLIVLVISIFKKHGR